MHRVAAKANGRLFRDARQVLNEWAKPDGSTALSEGTNSVCARVG